ncbi:MAG: DUF3048 domain-containing protein [Patescibacteria group bacterium]|nr:DUF3048 domain-containing protein [Patescibacteria group bacterium]MDD5554860.1 DUF3048 domain-containing protein [Patescibacteria group bacterium]
MAIRDLKNFSVSDTGEKKDGKPAGPNWRVICYIFIFLFLVLTFITFTYLITFYPDLFNRVGRNLNTLRNSQPTENICPGGLPRFIDGYPVPAGEENLFPMAVVIGNHPDGRPAFGLGEANLVYEAEVEGGITRYLAFFANGTDIKKIGPIRSARPYFIDWIKEMSALFVHCGGSPEALAKVYKENIFDFNEFYQGSYFWRDEKKPGPYNVFTSSANLEKYLESKNLTEGKFLSWQFKEEAPAGLETEDIEIGFKSPDFVVKWKYDKIDNEYIRYLAGEVQFDGEDSREIRAKNVIIQTEAAKVLDKELRLKMETLGSGKAIICLDGGCQEGEWQKSSPAARTRYYINGEEAKFNPGKIWIEVVRPELKIAYPAK